MGAEATATAEPGDVILHASSVALGRRALLITGPSGSGKSALALSLIALGAKLVSDDRTVLIPQVEGPPLAGAPKSILGVIEARFVGLMKAEVAPPTAIAAVADLSRIESARLPEPRHTDVLGYPLPLFQKVEASYFPAALMQFLRGGLAR